MYDFLVLISDTC
uniref:Uncharacterized protein n=1 Tax=Rhizophora mucronata TaxID=61149 RepID=A0A2P2QUK4_RHIMU